MVHKEFDLAREDVLNQDPIRKFALDEAEDLLLKAGVAWPNLEKVTPSVEQPLKLSEDEVKAKIDQMRESWKLETHTPQLITDLTRKLYELVSAHIDIPFTMPTEFPVDEVEIKAHEERGERAVYLPLELASFKDLPKLALAFRMLGNFNLPEHWTSNSEDKSDIKSGWRWVSEPKKPYQSGDLEEMGYARLSENEYLALGLFMKSMEGIYPDEDKSWIWIITHKYQPGQEVSRSFDHVGHWNQDSSLIQVGQIFSHAERLSAGVETI